MNASGYDLDHMTLTLRVCSLLFINVFYLIAAAQLKTPGSQTSSSLANESYFHIALSRIDFNIEAPSLGYVLRSGCFHHSTPMNTKHLKWIKSYLIEVFHHYLPRKPVTTP